MIVTTINVNGIRAAVKERSTDNLGLLAWLKETRADVVCLQETRADDAQIADALTPAIADGWHLASAAPHVKGRNGVAVSSRTPFDGVRIGCGADEFVSHGRYLEVDTAGVTVASLYFPTGEADTDRQREKERFMAAVATRMAQLLSRRRDASIGALRGLEHRPHRERHQELEGQHQEGRVPAAGAPVAHRPARHRMGRRGPADASRGGRARTRGGRGVARPSTTTPAGASTTSWPARAWPPGRRPPSPNAPRPTRCAGPITRR